MITIIGYMYRDASNNKRLVEVALVGELTAEHRKAIKQVLNYDTYMPDEDRAHFIPSQIGLPDLQKRFEGGVIDGEVDHPWHEWIWDRIRVENTAWALFKKRKNTDVEVAMVGEEPMTAQQLADNFAATKGRWDEAAAMARNGIATDLTAIGEILNEGEWKTPGKS